MYNVQCSIITTHSIHSVSADRFGQKMGQSDQLLVQIWHPCRAYPVLAASLVCHGSVIPGYVPNVVTKLDSIFTLGSHEILEEQVSSYDGTLLVLVDTIVKYIPARFECKYHNNIATGFDNTCHYVLYSIYTHVCVVTDTIFYIHAMMTCVPVTLRK